MDEPVIVLDLETTGLSAKRDSITEIAAVKIHNGEVMGSFHSLVNPGFPIPKHITTLTGITDEMVKDAPKIHELLPALKVFLGNHVIVAHNAGFDKKFLELNFLEHHNHELANQTLCTYKLANRLLDIPRRRLIDICEHFNVIHEQAHRAMSDVMATTKIFGNMIELLAESNINTTEKILAFQNLPRAKAIRLVDG